MKDQFQEIREMLDSMSEDEIFEQQLIEEQKI